MIVSTAGQQSSNTEHAQICGTGVNQHSNLWSFWINKENVPNTNSLLKFNHLQFCKKEKAINSFSKLHFLNPTCLTPPLPLTLIYSVPSLPEPDSCTPSSPAPRTSLAAEGEESTVDGLQTLIVIMTVVSFDTRSNIQLERHTAHYFQNPSTLGNTYFQDQCVRFRGIDWQNTVEMEHS